MRSALGTILSLVLFFSSPGLAATKDEPPDREMLRMMELLREMEMIKQMEMLRDMQVVESGVDPAKNSLPQKLPPAKKKETLK